MVTKTETTEILTEPKLQEQMQPSFKRWLKHFFYMPASKRYFSKSDQQQIAQAVKQAEQGHVGEIQVVIEGYIPSHQAYRQNTRLRAQQLFAELGVWDTEYNSGVLLYLNLCEQTVEVVIDRGIKQATTQQVWQQICDQIIAELKSKQYRSALENGVIEIGKVLNLFYNEQQSQQKADTMNELSNNPIILN
ncbi:TPM domain-containing protein [Acinetobacter sp. P8-3-8]|uniref:TPM domain-containing protein n=1 Tax=Acinetobacter sp. P8-3-8 TaxID=1029823 RepID=UPI0002485D9F|nr:TPM domain-containing protein [Acinetobacter sp. P8-3-8]